MNRTIGEGSAGNVAAIVDGGCATQTGDGLNAAVLRPVESK